MGIIRRTLEKLRTGLSKTRQKFTSSFRSLLTIGRKIDEDLLDDLEGALIGADVGIKSTLRIIEDLRQAYSEKRIEGCEQILDFLKMEMKSYWPQTDRSLGFAATGPTVILVAGVNGTGKTTSVAKLAWLLSQSGKKVILAAADTFRAAAVEQLTIW